MAVRFTDEVTINVLDARSGETYAHVFSREVLARKILARRQREAIVSGLKGLTRADRKLVRKIQKAIRAARNEKGADLTEEEIEQAASAAQDALDEADSARLDELSPTWMQLQDTGEDISLDGWSDAIRRIEGAEGPDGGPLGQEHYQLIDDDHKIKALEAAVKLVSGEVTVSEVERGESSPTSGSTTGRRPKRNGSARA